MTTNKEPITAVMLRERYEDAGRFTPPSKHSPLYTLLPQLAEIVEERDELRDEKNNPREFIDIVFDGPPAHESGRFIEVEGPSGASINVGTWVDRGNGAWALRIQRQVAVEQELAQLRAVKAAAEDVRKRQFPRVRDMWALDAALDACALESGDGQ